MHAAPHKLFGRSGDNLTVSVPVTLDEAVLGATITVPTLDGRPVSLKLPPGTPDGRTFRARGKGARRRDGLNGDLLVTVKVQVPDEITDETRAAMEAYRTARGESDPRSSLFDPAGG